MRYSSNSQINSIEAVKDFFNFIVNERHVNFHPDESFDQYVNLTTSGPALASPTTLPLGRPSELDGSRLLATFSPDECALYDRLMNEAFEVCGKVSEELIYELAEEAHHE